jgi:hypothetical protein
MGVEKSYNTSRIPSELLFREDVEFVKFSGSPRVFVARWTSAFVNPGRGVIPLLTFTTEHAVVDDVGVPPHPGLRYATCLKSLESSFCVMPEEFSTWAEESTVERTL